MVRAKKEALDFVYLDILFASFLFMVVRKRPLLVDETVRPIDSVGA